MTDYSVLHSNHDHMYPHSLEVLGPIAKDFLDPYSATTILAAVRNKCNQVARLAQTCPQHVLHDDFRNLTVWGEATYRDMLDHINVQMLQARDCALYAPLLSIVLPAMASPWFYYVVLASLHPSPLGPEFSICLFVTVCWLIQRAVFNHGLARYFETMETHQASFDFHGTIRSKRDEVAGATRLSFAYLRVLLATIPSRKPSSTTTGWLAAERRLFFSCKRSSRECPCRASLRAAGLSGGGQTVPPYGSIV